jgi:UDP-N-acetylglucosamine 2-epimerase (non-hydrolysing)
MARAHNPFGDGEASGRIVEAARRFLGVGSAVAI